MNMLDNIPRVRLAHLPTPLEKMENLTQRLKGPRLLIKRDDQTGLAVGGNKARKLEYLMADALTHQADTVVTLGAAQSNQARHTAAVAAKLGLHAVLLLHGEEPPLRTGNLLLDGLLGAEVRWMRSLHPEELNIEPFLEEMRAKGQKPYFIPYGASNEIGNLGYVLAMKELLKQLEENNLKANCMVVASCTGGIQAGLVLGAKLYGYQGKIIGISVELRKRDLMAKLVRLAQATIARWGWEISVEAQEFVVYDDYLGGGYGVLGSLEMEAINLVAQTEGILLDPVYTGRAMAGLLDLIKKRAFQPDETVIFWHTGGIPILFAYAEKLAKFARQERMLGHAPAR